MGERKDSTGRWIVQVGFPDQVAIYNFKDADSSASIAGKRYKTCEKHVSADTATERGRRRTVTVGLEGDDIVIFFEMTSPNYNEYYLSIE